MSNALRLPFDVYQRYRLVSDVVERLRPAGASWRLLEVGGAQSQLADFLGKDRVYCADLTPRPDGPRQLSANGLRLPFKDGAFDAVCALDLLEHIAPKDRAALIAECARVSSGYVLLAGPFESPKVRHAEVLLRRFLKEKLGLSHKELEEHRTNGLPLRNEVGDQLQALGAKVQSVGHANLERWFALKTLELYLGEDPGLGRIAQGIYEFYNRNLYRSDVGEELYRYCIVGALQSKPAPNLKGLFQAATPPEGAAEGISELLKSLLGFDAERRKWRRERAAFEQSLAEMQQQLEDGEGAAEGTLAPRIPGPSAASRRVLPVANPAATSAVTEPDPGERLRELETELANGRHLAETEARARAAAEGQLAQLQDQARIDRQKRTRLEASLEAARSELDVLRPKAASDASEVERLGARLAPIEVERDGLAIKSQQLQAELDYVKEREQEERLARQAIEGDFKEHREKQRTQRKQSAEADRHILALETELKQRDALLESQRAEQAKARAALDDVGRLRAEADGMIQDLAGKLEVQRGLEQELRQELGELRAEKDKLQAQCGSARGELKRVRDLLEAEREQAQRKETSLQAELATSQEQLGQRREELREARRRLKETTAELEQLRSGAPDFERRLAEQSGALETLELRHKEANLARDQLARERDGMRATILDLQEQIMAQSSRCQQLEERISSVDELERQWNEEREGFNLTVSEILGDLQQHREVLVEMRTERDRARVQVQALERELEVQRGLVETVMRERDLAAAAREALLVQRDQALKPASGVGQAGGPGAPGEAA